MSETVGAAGGRRNPPPWPADDVTALLQLLIVEGGKVAGAFAHLHSLHPTDVEAMTRVMVADGRGAPTTPGALGAELGLSSGAVTAVLDRLERAGHVVRARDDADRRRVLLHVSPRGLALGQEFFGPLGERTDAVMATFTDGELDVVRRFLAGAGEALAAHREHLARHPDRQPDRHPDGDRGHGAT